MFMSFNQLPSNEVIASVVSTLKSNGMTAHVVDSAAQAKDKVTTLIPEKSEVMTMTSITLEQTGIAEYINNSGKYDSVRGDLEKMNRETDTKQMQRLGAAPDWSIGSVHAITHDGQVVIASNTGSQLPGYSYGSPHVVWVVGAQKIVENLEVAMQRINEYIVPLESKRARKAYGLPETFHTNVSKLLIVNREINPERIHIIIVKEKLGF